MKRPLRGSPAAFGIYWPSGLDVRQVLMSTPRASTRSWAIREPHFDDEAPNAATGVRFVLEAA